MLTSQRDVQRAIRTRARQHAYEEVLAAHHAEVMAAYRRRCEQAGVTPEED